MGSASDQRVVFFLFWAALFLHSITSCVSAGSSQLSIQDTEKIICGTTTRDEVVKALGEPERILKLDKEGLENYLSRIGVSDSPPLNFKEDLFEVLIYNSWNQASGLVFTPSYEEAKFCIVVLDGKGICVTRFYKKESSFKF